MIITVVQLIPHGELVIAGVDDATVLESRRRVINNKLLDLAIAQCKTNRLDVLISAQNSREAIPQLYNDIWDGQLVHDKAQTLDARVVFDANLTQTTIVLTAPLAIFPTSLKFASKQYLECQLEANTDYVLYDNPQHTDKFSQPEVALGGTFDRLHGGHKKLLSIALECATKRVVVGVTSDVMLQKKKNAHRIEHFEVRFNRVVDFCNSLKRPGVDVQVVQIDDAFGPTVTMPQLTALVCSSETLVGAQAVNVEREKRGYSPLQPIVVMRSNAYVLSSTFMRDKL